MSNLYITFVAVAQMLAFAAPAYLLMRFKKYDERSISVFVTLLLFVSQPCLTAYSFQKATVLVRDGVVPLEQMLLRGAIILGLSLVLQAAFLALSYFVLRKRQEEAQYRIFVIAACFGNSGFFGVPILEAVMGEAHPEVAMFSALFSLVMNTMSWTVASTIITRDRKYISPKKIFLNPNTIAAIPSNFKNHYIDFAFYADNFENSYLSGKKILVNDDSITKYSTKLHSANWQLTLTALQNNNRISENDLIAFYTNEGFSNILPEEYPLEIATELKILHADLSKNAFLIEETFTQNGTLIIPKTLPDKTNSFLNQDTSLFLYVDILTENTNTRAASFELIIPIQKEQWKETEVAYEIPFSTTLANGFKYKAQVYFKPDSSKTYYVKQAQTLTEETGDLTYTFTTWDEE
ncbi:MAG: AEC family transporter [Prevotella sp.]|nr:AEC family transporter [Prevotella sp.]